MISSNELQLNQQVIFKQPLRGGLKQIKLGTVLAFSADKKSAVVSFPAESMRRTIPVEQLTPAQSVYGRTRVDLHSGRRLVSFLR